jgi:hypothetical protein
MPTSAPYCFTHQTIPIQPSLKDRRANVWPLNETSVFPVQLGIVLLRRKALCVRHRITPRTIYAVPSRALLWRRGDQPYAGRFLDAEAFRPLCVQWLAIRAARGHWSLNQGATNGHVLDRRMYSLLLSWNHPRERIKRQTGALVLAVVSNPRDWSLPA